LLDSIVAGGGAPSMASVELGYTEYTDFEFACDESGCVLAVQQQDSKLAQSSECDHVTLAVRLDDLARVVAMYSSGLLQLPWCRTADGVIALLPTFARECRHAIMKQCCQVICAFQGTRTGSVPWFRACRR
jgi:hypothetical protein